MEAVSSLFFSATSKTDLSITRPEKDRQGPSGTLTALNRGNRLLQGLENNPGVGQNYWPILGQK